MKFWVHNKQKARKEAGPKLPKLRYQDGTEHVLFPDGHQENIQPRRDHSISGKTARRERIKQRRIDRERLLIMKQTRELEASQPPSVHAGT
jgi:hypothetical protein